MFTIYLIIVVLATGVRWLFSDETTETELVPVSASGEFKREVGDDVIDLILTFPDYSFSQWKKQARSRSDSLDTARFETGWLYALYTHNLAPEGAAVSNGKFAYYTEDMLKQLDACFSLLRQRDGLLDNCHRLLHHRFAGTVRGRLNDDDFVVHQQISHWLVHVRSLRANTLPLAQCTEIVSDTSAQLKSLSNANAESLSKDVLNRLDREVRTLDFYLNNDAVDIIKWRKARSIIGTAIYLFLFAAFLTLIDVWRKGSRETFASTAAGQVGH